MTSWARPCIAFWGAFCATVGVNALSTATGIIALHFNVQPSLLSSLTSLYLIAEVAALPLVPLFIEKFGLTGLLRFALCGFFLSSVSCFFSPALEHLLFSRCIQGIFGGLLTTTPFIAMKSDLSKRHQPIAIGMAVVVGSFAPIVGPLLTAQLNEKNVLAIFAIMAIIPLLCLPFLTSGNKIKESNTTVIFKRNVLSLITFSLGLIAFVWSAEQIKSGATIHTNAALLFSVAVILLSAAHQYQSSNPLLPIKTLLKTRYTGLLVMSASMGVIIFGFLYLIPYFLIKAYNMNVDSLFTITFYATIPQILWVPAVLFLRKHISPYALILLGCAFTIISVTLLSTDAALSSNAEDWMLSQLARGMAIPLISLSLGLLLIRLPSEGDAPALASAFGLCRTIGGVIGVSGLTLYIDNRQSYYASTTTAEESWLLAMQDTASLVNAGVLIMGGYAFHLLIKKRKAATA
tara:strand:- start:13528 stop:14913 length:1386 start_codon:yes stop_codon:yes gene_type:complete